MNKIVFDVDGVIQNYDFSDLLKRYLRLEDFTNEDILEYDVSNCLGVPEDEVKQMFKGACQEEIKPEFGAIETMTDLLVKGNQVYIWTNRINFSTTEVIGKLLKEACIPYTALLKNLDFPVDAVFDDNVPKLLYSRNYCKNLFLFSRPWNSKCKNVRHYFRWVYNWGCIQDVLAKMDI
jgi:hypothetical protein